MSARVLIVPGWLGSGPGHWQALWAEELADATMVEQDSWIDPDPRAWAFRLAEAAKAHPGAIIVAHSLGVPTLLHAIRHDPALPLAGALLVAPADVDRVSDGHDAIAGFAPCPRIRLPFPAIVAASRNDPYIRIDRAISFARDWGAEFADLGYAGHVNPASGHGPWPAGLELLDRLQGRIEAERARRQGSPSWVNSTLYRGASIAG